MDNIWSENKVINHLMNILLFLMGINFLHYGQLLLPLMCLILFIDNKMVFKVNRPIVFVLLCLFAISFYAFSYQLGFYSVMGFTLPMAYYIGSNMNNPSINNIKKIIYLIALSMGLHLALNFIYNVSTRGFERVLHSSSHRDIWIKDKISITAMAVDLDILIGCLYYLLTYEKNKVYKLILLSLFVFDMVYCVIMGRRTSVMLLAISFIIVFLYETFVFKKIDYKRKKYFIYGIGSILTMLILIMAIYNLNIFNLKEKMDQLYIISKFKKGIIDSSRIKLLLSAYGMFFNHLWGGRQITSILGWQVHELWMDVFDFAGVIPYLMMIVLTILFVINYVKIMKAQSIDKKHKTLLLSVFVCIMIQMCLEPVMTGESIFLIVTVLIGSLLERLMIYE